jgi:WD40 repeat protein
MNEEQKHNWEQQGQNLEGLPHAAEFDPDATVLAPWSKRRRELEIASMSTEVKPFISESMGEGTVPTEVKPFISESVGEGTVPTEVKPFISAPNVPLQPRTRRGMGRRALLVGGAAAIGIVGNGALAMTLLRQTSQMLSPGSPAVRPVHFAPGQRILRLTGHTQSVTNVVWSPDGRYLASAGYDRFAMLWDITAFLRQSSPDLQIIDRPTRKWDLYPYGLSTDGLHWTPDGQYLLTAIADDDVSGIPALLDPFTNNSKPRRFTNSSLKDPYFKYPIMGPQGPTLAAIDGTLHRNHKVDLWQLQASTKPYASLTYTDANQFIGDSSTLNKIGWSCDGKQLAGCTTYDEAIIWDTQNRTVNAVVKLPGRLEDGKPNQVLRIALSWSPTDPQVLAVSNLDTVAIVNAQQKKVLYQLYTDDKGALNATPDPKNPSLAFPHVLGITWSPDGRYLAANYVRSPKVFVWDLQAKNARTEHGLTIQSALFPLNGSTNRVPIIYDLSWSPNGRYLAMGSSDQSITIWKVGD